MAERQLLKDGSEYFFAGCDSYTLPRVLSPNEFIASMNTVCRGGIIQTRPGSESKFSIPGVNLQGFKLFTPSFGSSHLVIAVDGYIYASAAPFSTYRLLPNLRFNPASKYIVLEECLQSTDYTISGELIPLSRPRKILMIQDGLTRAGYWDGGTSRHLNPTPSTGETPAEGLDETVIGLWMKWSGNRLWVEQNGVVRASDLGNPLRFKDAQILNEGRAFYLKGECTGMVETPDQKGLIVFTRNNASLFQTHIADRTAWFVTNDFQSTIFPRVGCASPRSIVLQYGLIWWFSPHGLINSDQAMSSNRTSRIDYQDNEMICSKGNMGPDLSMICSAVHENYLLVSVPSGDVVNRHTWCLDQAVFEGPINAWNSYWTGWNPVEWASGEVDGEDRLFFASRDSGGCLRIWEAMKSNRTDNGTPITCFAQLREHDFGDKKSLKKFHNAEFYCHEILGDVSWMACASSTKGSFYRIGGSELVATIGGIYFDELYDLEKCMYGHRPQVRTLKTASDVTLNNCNSGGVESDFPNDLDRAFSLLLVWSGMLGLSGYTIFAQVDEDSTDGDCMIDEVGPNSLSEQGCSAKDKFVNTCTFPRFVSSQVSVLPCDRGGISIQAMADASSIISQADADRKAKGAATLKALSLCNCSPQVFWNTEQSSTAFCQEGMVGASVTRRILAHRVFSYTSQVHANNQALLQAAALAESALVCVNTESPLIAFIGGDQFSSGDPVSLQLFASDYYVARIDITNQNPSNPTNVTGITCTSIGSTIGSSEALDPVVYPFSVPPSKSIFVRITRDGLSQTFDVNFTNGSNQPDFVLHFSILWFSVRLYAEVMGVRSGLLSVTSINQLFAAQPQIDVESIRSALTETSYFNGIVLRGGSVDAVGIRSALTETSYLNNIVLRKDQVDAASVKSELTSTVNLLVLYKINAGSENVGTRTNLVSTIYGT